MRASLRKSVATRPDRTRFQLRGVDPGRHLVSEGELQLIIMDYNIISIVVRKNLHPLCYNDSSN